MMNKREVMYYEGPAARCANQKMVVAFDCGRLLELHYTGDPGWKMRISAGRVFNVRVGYRLNARGDKWLVKSLEVLGDNA